MAPVNAVEISNGQRTAGNGVIDLFNLTNKFHDSVSCKRTWRNLDATRSGEVQGKLSSTVDRTLDVDEAAMSFDDFFSRR